MTFAIYADPLSVFTSSMPQRGILTELIKTRSSDSFVFFLHSRYKSDDVINQFLLGIKDLPNWEIVEIKFPQKLSRLMQLFGFSFPRLPKSADLFISPDIETFGRQARPVINFLPDMTVFDDVRHTSLSLFNTLFRRKSIKRMDKETDLLVVASRFTSQRYLHHFPESRNKVEVIYNGIDDLWFSTSKVEGSPDTPYWIWMGGAYNSRKNLDRLFCAYREVKGIIAAVPKIMIVGMDKTSSDKMFAYLQKLDLSDSVIIKPKQALPELISLVDLSKGLLFPSIYEGFGLPVVEVFSRGKPVMTSDVSSLPEISNGLAVLCDPLSNSSITEGLKTMINMQDNEEAGNRRRNWAAQFTYKRAAAQLDENINKLI